MAELDLGKLCNLTLERLQRFGIEVDPSRINLSTTTIEEVNNDNFHDIMETVDLSDDPVKVMDAIHAKQSTTVTAGFMRPRFDSDGFHYDVTLVTRKDFPTGDEELDTIQALGTLAHEIGGHVWMYEHSAFGQAVKEVLAKKISLEDELRYQQQRFRSLSEAVSDFTIPGPDIYKGSGIKRSELRPVPYRNLDDVTAAKMKERSVNKIIKTREQLQWFKDMNFGLHLNYLNIKRSLATRDLVSLSSSRDVYGSEDERGVLDKEYGDILRDAKRILREGWQKKKAQAAVYKEADQEKLELYEEAIATYQRVVELAERYLDIFEQSSAFHEKARLLNEGWPEIISKLVVNDYKEETGSRCITTTVEYLSELHSQKEQLIKQIEKAETPEDKTLLETQVSMVDIRINSALIQHMNSRVFLSDYQDSANLFTGFDSYKAAKQAALTCVTDLEVRKAIDPNYRPPLDFKGKVNGAVAYVKGFFGKK